MGSKKLGKKNGLDHSDDAHHGCDERAQLRTQLHGVADDNRTGLESFGRDSKDH